MTATYLLRLRNFVLFILVQILIFAHIRLFGYATACVALIFLLKLPRYTSRNELLIWGVLMGLIIDIYSVIHRVYMQQQQQRLPFFAEQHLNSLFKKVTAMTLYQAMQR